MAASLGQREGAPLHALPTPSVSRFILHLSLSHHHQPHLGNSRISSTPSLSLCLSLPLFSSLPVLLPQCVSNPSLPCPLPGTGRLHEHVGSGLGTPSCSCSRQFPSSTLPSPNPDPKMPPSVPYETQTSEGLPDAEDHPGSQSPGGLPFP